MLTVLAVQQAPLAQMIQLIVLTSCALGAVYFIFYRPTVGAQNRQRRVVAGLRLGDRVVTLSGFLATVVGIEEMEDGETELLLDLGGITVRARPIAVTERLPRPDEDEDEIDEESGAEEAEDATQAVPVAVAPALSGSGGRARRGARG